MREQAPASRRFSAQRASILHAFGCASLRAPLALVLSVFRRSMVKLDWRFLPRYLFDLMGGQSPVWISFGLFTSGRRIKSGGGGILVGVDVELFTR